MMLTGQTHSADTADDGRMNGAALAAYQWQLAKQAAMLFTLAMRQKDGPCPMMIIRAKAGPVRDIFWSRLSALMGDLLVTRIGPNMSAEDLKGDIDLSGSLSSGQLRTRHGLLERSQNGVLLLTVADIAEPDFIHALCSEIDTSDALPRAMIAFDESDDDVVGVDASLVDRAQFHIDLSWVDRRTAMDDLWCLESDLSAALDINIDDGQLVEIANHCALFGLHSARPANHAVWIAKLAACYDKSGIITLEHIQQAIEISIIPRALCFPEPPQPPEEMEPNPPPETAHNDNFEDQSSEQNTLDDEGVPEEITPEIAASLLTPEMLSALFAQGIKQQNFSRQKGEMGRVGGKINPAERGAPKPSRKGNLRSKAALDLPATLRNAAPWQRLRQVSSKGQQRDSAIIIWPEDIHLKRYKHAPSSVLIFIVDASGSTALNRLSEAKGAMELLLAESYSRRDYVALLAFRKQGCDILLPPTRSLVRAKRELVSLSGGGATPLASGLKSALSLAEDQKKAGRQPTLILLTDGSANIALSGDAGRSEAMADAEQMASLIGQSNHKSIVIDIGKRRQSKGKDLAQKMMAQYVALPFTSAETLSTAVKSAIDA